MAQKGKLFLKILKFNPLLLFETVESPFVIKIYLNVCLTTLTSHVLLGNN